MTRRANSKPRLVQAAFATPRAVFALVLREMATTYGRSAGGYFWAVLEPAAGIALLTVVFSAGFSNPPLGISFSLYYATGLLPFMLFSDVSGKLGQTLQFSKSLLEYPRVTFVDALLARLLLNTLTQVAVGLVVLGFILAVTDTRLTEGVGKIALGYGMALALAAGIGILNSFLSVAFPFWQSIWSISTRPLFLVSGLVFQFESVPRPYSDYLWFNPLVHVVGMVRDGFYPFYHPNYLSVAYVFAVSAVTAVLGLILLRAHHRDIQTS